MSKSLKIDLNYKIFSKSQANILLRYYEQTLSNFQ